MTRTSRDRTSTDGGGAGRGDVLMVVGAGHLSTHRLDRPLVIGRREGDVVIDHRALSRRHLRVDPGPPITVTDLGTTNGTTVAGTLRRGGPAVAVQPGEAFQVGALSFVLVGAGAGPGSVSAVADGLRVLDPSPGGVPAVVRDLAATTLSVLILGETGVGKEVLADTVHALSGRPGPLTKINCAALSASLLESELFGHEKGAFTGAGAARAGLLEAADTGTVFLDEIGELPAAIQAKLLRALEQREVVRLGSTRPIALDLRFVAATNRDLRAEVDDGRFRRDLFFRLDGVTLMIPPLRERRAQIGALAAGFVTGGARLSTDALAALAEHDWPGNVRELKAVIERAAVLARGGVIERRHLTLGRAAEPAAAPAAAVGEAVPPARTVLSDEDQADRARVLAALDECAGNQTRAAKRLGISRTTLVTKLLRYQIARPRV